MARKHKASPKQLRALAHARRVKRMKHRKASHRHPR